MSRAVLSIGSNLGDRLTHLRAAVHGLADVLVAASPVYETAPWGGVEQPDYLNAVLIVADPDIDAWGWLRRGQRLERAAGRDRAREVRWGPRPLDVDLVHVDGVLSDDPELVLPHPAAAERAFVLLPWLDVDPAAVLPGHGPVAALLDRLRSSLPAGADLGLRRRDDLVLVEPIRPGRLAVKPTRSLDLLLAALIGGLAVHLLVRAGYGSMPRLPLLAGVTLLVLAIAEVVLGNTLRARIRRRPGTRPVQPLQAARAVALAKASSLAGAITAGAWLGVLAYVAPRSADVAAAAADTQASVVGLICALALVGGALWLERCCRTPDDHDHDDDVGRDAPPPDDGVGREPDVAELRIAREGRPPGRRRPSSEPPGRR